MSQKRIRVDDEVISQGIDPAVMAAFQKNQMDDPRVTSFEHLGWTAKNFKQQPEQIIQLGRNLGLSDDQLLYIALEHEYPNVASLVAVPQSEVDRMIAIRETIERINSSGSFTRYNDELEKLTNWFQSVYDRGVRNLDYPKGYFLPVNPIEQLWYNQEMGVMPESAELSKKLIKFLIEKFNADPRSTIKKLGRDLKPWLRDYLMKVFLRHQKRKAKEDAARRLDRLAYREALRDVCEDIDANQMPPSDLLGLAQLMDISVAPDSTWPDLCGLVRQRLDTMM